MALVHQQGYWWAIAHKYTWQNQHLSFAYCSPHSHSILGQTCISDWHHNIWHVVLWLTPEHCTVMQALLDFALSSGQQWAAAAVVFAFRFSDGEVLFSSLTCWSCLSWSCLSALVGGKGEIAYWSCDFLWVDGLSFENYFFLKVPLKSRITSLPFTCKMFFKRTFGFLKKKSKKSTPKGHFFGVKTLEINNSLSFFLILTKSSQ